MLIKLLIVSSCIAVCLIAMGLGIGIGVFFKLHNIEIDNAERDFSSIMSFEASSINDTIRSTIRAVHTIRSVFDIVNEDIHPYDMFLPFMETSQEGIVGTHSLGWISRVDNIDRESMINRSRSYGRDYSNFEITMVGKTDPAPIAPTYYVLQYIYPLLPNVGAIGLDLLSEPVRRDAIGRSILSGSDAVTSRIFLPHTKYSQPGVLYISPLMDGSYVKGYGVGVFIIGDIFNIGSNINRQAMVSVFDSSSGEINIDTFLWSNTGEYGPTFGDDKHIRSINRDIHGSPFVYRHKLSVGDRTWTIVMVPRSSFMDRYRTGSKWIALICIVFGFLSLAILVCVIASVFYLKWRSMRHIHEVEIRYVKEHADKTARLLNRISRMDNARKQIFNTIPDMVVVTDNTGRVIYANSAFYTIMGIEDRHVREGINIGRFFIEKDTSFFINTHDQFQETTVRPGLGKDIPITYNSFSIDISPRSFAGGEVGDEDTYTEDNVYVIIARDLRDNKSLLSELHANKIKLQYILSESEFEKRWKDDTDGKFREKLLHICKKKKSEENVLFLMDIDRYKAIPKFSDRVDECEHIISKYLSDDGERQLNITHNLKSDILDRVDRDIGDSTLFDNIYTSIKISITTEIIPLLREHENERLQYI